MHDKLKSGLLLNHMILQNHIYVMRHGESTNNALGIESCKFETQTQYGLTDVGHAQVAETAHGAPQFDVILSSPFRRAIETAQIMAESQALELEIEVDLHEFRLPSEFDQQPYETAEVMIHDPFTDLNTTPIGDSESFDSMMQRLQVALTKIDQAHTNSTILLVSHGSPVEALIQIAKGVNTGFGAFNDLPKNAEIVHLNLLNLVA